MPAAVLSFLRPLDERAEHADGRGTVVVIGNFDGVHRGHRAVLTEAVGEARARGLHACVLTFDPHPAGVLGRTAPPMLTTLDRRAELMGALGVELVYVRRFDLAFAASSPERFARELLAGGLMARVVVVGQNFRFGAKRSGDLATLQALGAQLGFEARAHAMACDAEGPFSSTRVRDAVRAGDLGVAEAVLGRPHALSGVVARGRQLGRTLGFPTANLGSVPELLPPDGVYVVEVEEVSVAGPRRGGVMNVGLRPTVARGDAPGTPARTIEAHVFDFDGDLYGKHLRVHLVGHLRAEQRFDGVEALRAQITADAAAARELLAARMRAG